MSDELTPEQLGILRSALGLSSWNKKPSRNWLHSGDQLKHPETVAELERLGYLEATQFPGPGGMERHMKATDKGIEYAMSHLPA